MFVTLCLLLMFCRASVADVLWMFVVFVVLFTTFDVFVTVELLSMCVRVDDTCRDASMFVWLLSRPTSPFCTNG